MEIFELLTADVNKKIDELGYQLLRTCGYDVAKVHKSKKKMRRLKKAMKRRGESLEYRTMVHRETGDLLIWFELVDRKSGNIYAKSQGLKLIQRKGEKNEI